MQNEGNTFFLGIDIGVGRMLVNDAKQANEMINKVLNITTQNPLVAGEIISCLFQMIQMCLSDAKFAKQKKII
jgi:hypothetical protein